MGGASQDGFDTSSSGSVHQERQHNCQGIGLEESLALHWALRLRFFSKEARDFVDVLPDVSELDIDNFQRLLSGLADQYLISSYKELSFSERQAAAHKRFLATRNGLQAIMSNAVLFEQVGRFYIRQINEIDPKRFTEADELVFKTFDRAVICHFLAALAFARLHVLELYHIAWPWYIPAFRGLCETGGHNLFASYKDLLAAILELAHEDRREWLYENLLFALTGLIKCESAD
jgi:hypothetical protein